MALRGGEPVWHLLSERAVYDGLIQVVRRTFRTSDGVLTDWDVVAPGEMVAVVALTTDRSVLVVRQFRAGPMCPLYELPGGYVDDNESVCDAAARELLEETGFEPGCMAHVGSSWVAPDAALRLHAVVALDCQQVAPPSGDVADGRIATWAVDRFVRHVRAGDFTDQASAYRCLDALGLLGPVPHGVARYPVCA